MQVDYLRNTLDWTWKTSPVWNLTMSVTSGVTQHWDDSESEKLSDSGCYTWVFHFFCICICICICICNFKKVTKLLQESLRSCRTVGVIRGFSISNQPPGRWWNSEVSHHWESTFSSGRLSESSHVVVTWGSAHQRRATAGQHAVADKTTFRVSVRSFLPWAT